MKAAKHAAGKASGQECVSPGQRSGLAALRGLCKSLLVSFAELRENTNVVRLIILLLCTSRLT